MRERETNTNVPIETLNSSVSTRGGIYLFENESHLTRNQTTIRSDRSELINCRIEFKVGSLKLDLDLTTSSEGSREGGSRFSSEAERKISILFSKVIVPR